MCGINGMINLENEGSNHQSILRMNTLLAHRGPDGEGIYTTKGLALGHTRLSVIDLSSAANQPFIIDEKYIMTYNGECYNYLDLRRKLEEKGHSFRTKSDTEVVLRMYIEYGVDFVKHINGIFSLAIYDKNKDRLLLARDHLGVKPLYFYQSQTKFIFSSEIKPILSQTKKFNINQEALPYYFSYRYVPGETTLFENINMIPPATILIINSDRETKAIKYWDLDLIEERQISKIEANETFSDLFSNSVKHQTISDAPLGVFLSGGIDSAASASEAIKRN